MADGFGETCRVACEAAASVEGLIRREECRFLFLAGALPTAEGEVLEIGSYKGRSTVALAKGAGWAGQGGIAQCDPFLADDEKSGRPVAEIFADTLSRHGLTGIVETHRMPSAELATAWRRPLRLLWIDGCHDYEAVKGDAAGFFPHLVPGAIVALHDVGRKRMPGPTRCFIDDVVLSDAFGMCGMCEYTGWAQFVGSGGIAAYAAEKSRVHRFLALRLARQLFGTTMGPLDRWRYRRLRRERSFEQWIRSPRAKGRAYHYNAGFRGRGRQRHQEDALTGKHATLHNEAGRLL